MRRKIFILCITIVLFLTCSGHVFAEDFDWNKTGSISVTLIEQTGKEPIVGAELCVYHIATVALNENGKLIYDYTKDFKQIGVAIDDSSLVTKLDAYVSQHNLPSVKIITDEEGTAFCKELALGLYFVKQTGGVEGFAPCTSFLVTVPKKDAEGYTYTVDASPKTEAAKLTTITIRKVWNTDAATEATDSVKVQLLKNGNVVKTATLSAKNNWQETYTNMPESDAYSIKEVAVPKGFTATYNQAGYIFTVTNTSTLIQTGQLIWPIPVLAVVGMIFLAVGIMLLQKKRKTNA